MFVMEGGTGVYYQAMPAVGPDGKNIMKLIPVQKVNGRFYQTSCHTDRDAVDLQLKAYAKPVHPPAASSYQTQTRLPSLQPIADGRYVLKTQPEVRTLSNPVKTQLSVTNFSSHNPKQVHVPPAAPSVSQYSVQLPPQTTGHGMVAAQTLPVTVKSPVLPNGHFLQIPPNAKVRTLPATALPQSIKCRIMNSVNNTPNLEKAPQTVLLVSPVNSVKLNSDQCAKPGLTQKTLSQNTPANLQTPACVPKTTEEVKTPIKWVVQEGTGASAPCLIPVSTPNANPDRLKTIKNVNSVGTVNDIKANKPTPPQTGQEKITPGKDNALVMCNGKVYFVAKKNSEIAKDVMISEGGKRGVVSTSPALPASSALASNSSKQDPKINVSEIIDLCDDDEETSTCLGGAPGNLPTPSQTEVDESDEDSNVIFVSYIPPKSDENVANSASQNKGEEHAVINEKSVSQNEVAHAETEKDGGVDNASATGNKMIDEQLKETQLCERNLNCVSESVNVEDDKLLENECPPDIKCQDDAAVAENVSMLEQLQNVCIQPTGNTEKVENPSSHQRKEPKSDYQLRKEFGIISDVQICLERTRPAVKPDHQIERFIINKRTLDGLRKVIQESKLQSKIQQMIQVPNSTLQEDEGLMVKKKKQEQDGSQDTPFLSTTDALPSECSVVPMESSPESQTCPEEVSLTQLIADKVHMQSELPAEWADNTCCLTPTPKIKTTQTASHPICPSSARKTPARSKKSKVCTACPCGAVLGATEATSSQDKPNPCTVVQSNKGTRRSCSNKTPGGSRQTQKRQDPAKKSVKKRLSRSPRKEQAPLESSACETSHNISPASSVNITPSPSSSSSLLDCNNQTVSSECDNMSSSNTDAKTSQQDTSRAETAPNDPIMCLSTKHQGPKIDIFPTQELYSSETLDAEEIKRRERIKRLKDLLKEKEAALERMQQNMNV